MGIRDRYVNYLLPVTLGIVFACLLALGFGVVQEAQGAKGDRMTTQVDQSGERNEYNFVADGSFENVISEWENEEDADGGTGPLWEIKLDGTYARSGQGYAERVGSAGTARRLWNLRVFDVVPEQIVHAEIFRPSSSGAGVVEHGIRWYDEDGATISDSLFSATAAGTNRIFGRLIPPANAVRGQMFIETQGAITARYDDAFAAQFPSHLAPLAETSPQASNNVQSTRSNLVYGDLADTANSPSVDFIAPPNGRAFVTVSAFMSSSAAGSKAFMGYQVVDLTDSSVFQDTATERSAGSASANGLTLTRVSEVSGLVPGRSYRARAKYRSASGGTTITAEDRRIIVQPALGVL